MKKRNITLISKYSGVCHGLNALVLVISTLLYGCKAYIEESSPCKQAEEWTCLSDCFSEYESESLPESDSGTSNKPACAINDQLLDLFDNEATFPVGNKQLNDQSNIQVPKITCDDCLNGKLDTLPSKIEEDVRDKGGKSKTKGDITFPTSLSAIKKSIKTETTRDNDSRLYSYKRSRNKLMMATVFSLGIFAQGIYTIYTDDQSSLFSPKQEYFELYDAKEVSKASCELLFTKVPLKLVSSHACEDWMFLLYDNIFSFPRIKDWLIPKAVKIAIEEEKRLKAEEVEKAKIIKKHNLFCPRIDNWLIPQAVQQEALVLYEAQEIRRVSCELLFAKISLKIESLLHLCESLMFLLYNNLIFSFPGIKDWLIPKAVKIAIEETEKAKIVKKNSLSCPKYR